MMTLQTMTVAAPVAYPQVRAAEPVETVTAVKPPEGADRTRNDVAQDAGKRPDREAPRARDPAADPAEPKGPPPAFAANVLEAERARFREGELTDAEVTAARRENREAAEEKAAEAKDDRADAREAPQPTRSAYGDVREDAPRRLDVSR